MSPTHERDRRLPAAAAWRGLRRQGRYGQRALRGGKVLRAQRLCWVVCGALVMIGCGRGQSRIAAPALDPTGAAAKAMAEFDTDGDGSLTKQELQTCPGMLWAIKWYDKDNNGAICEQEIVDRLRVWQDQKLGIQPIVVEVQLGGRPLAGASVKFVPEGYLGDALKPATGTTDRRGIANVSMAADAMPADLRSMTGIRGGVYRIEVTHPDRAIPPKYNSATTLGREIAVDTIQGSIFLNLKP